MTTSRTRSRAARKARLRREAGRPQGRRPPRVPGPGAFSSTGLLDLARESGCRRTRGAYLASPDEYPEEVLRNGLPGDRPTPEEMTAYRERLEIVARCVETLDVARLNRGPAREGDRAAATSPSCRTEFSLTQILDRPLTGRVFFEEVIRRSRPPDQVQLLFQRRVTRRTPDRSRIRGHHRRLHPLAPRRL